MILIIIFSNSNIPLGCRVEIKPDSSPYDPVPILFTAAIWNLYKVPGNSEFAINDLSEDENGPVVVAPSVYLTIYLVMRGAF